MIKIKFWNGRIETMTSWKQYNNASLSWSDREWKKIKMIWHEDMGIIWPHNKDVVTPYHTWS